MNSSSAIICWKDKILLFHRDDILAIPDPDCWQIPGGGIEKGETPLEGLKRELKEEVSYCPKNITYLGKIKKKDGTMSYIYSSIVGDNEAKLFKHGVGEGQEINFFTLDGMGDLKLDFGLKPIHRFFKSDLKESIQSKNFKNIFLKLSSMNLWTKGDLATKETT